jgi:hypothetical protein
VLYDGTNRDHIYFDNGKCYVYDASLDPVVKEDSGSTTFATDNVDLYSIIQVGSYMVFADRAETTPYKWKNGDANLTKLCASGTEYKFRYLVNFQRRVIGLYSDQSEGNIDVRWSTDWPTTAITSLNYPAANQLYIPSDDPIVGGATMGQDRCYIYSENSISQLVYYPDYTAPFRCYTVVPQQGGVNHHSIVNIGDRHYFFNRNYGFCEYRGGKDIVPISRDIKTDVESFDSDYYDVMVGSYVPFTREVVWTVAADSNSTPSALYFYNIDTQQWRKEDKAMRFVDSWRMYDNYSWNELIAEIGGTGIWSDAGAKSWGYYASMRERLVYSNTDGKLYYQDADAIAGTDNLDGYRVEPIIALAGKGVRTKLKEIWFDMSEVGNYSIDVNYRGGSTAGEVEAASWTSIGSVSCNSPEFPVLRMDKTDYLHQIKWGTNLDSEKFGVSEIRFKFTVEKGGY